MGPNALTATVVNKTMAISISRRLHYTCIYILVLYAYATMTTLHVCRHNYIIINGETVQYIVSRRFRFRFLAQLHDCIDDCTQHCNARNHTHMHYA